MSLDVYLKGENPVARVEGPQIFVREDGQTKRISRQEWDRRFPGQEPIILETDEPGPNVYEANITHNLNKMAEKAGIYEHLWRPDELGLKRASELVDPLTQGLERLRANPEQFKAFNPPNGWGTYEGLVKFVEEYLLACKKFPAAEVIVCR